MTRERFAARQFSYVSKIPGAEGCRLDGDLIASYDEVFERAPVLVKLGFSDERILRAVKGWAKPS